MSQHFKESTMPNTQTWFWFDPTSPNHTYRIPLWRVSSLESSLFSKGILWPLSKYTYSMQNCYQSLLSSKKWRILPATNRKMSSDMIGNTKQLWLYLSICQPRGMPNPKIWKRLSTSDSSQEWEKTKPYFLYYENQTSFVYSLNLFARQTIKENSYTTIPSDSFAFKISRHL